MQDCISRFGVDLKRITLAGFSGGARQAGNANLEINEITSVIACGAGVPYSKNLDRKAFNLLSFAGNTDFNYLELKKMDELLKESKINHLLIEFNGIHDWLSAYIFSDAFYWLEFDAVRKGLATENKVMYDRYWKKMMTGFEYQSNHHCLDEYKYATRMFKILQDSFSSGWLRG
ncbi:MAG: hypothetical protein MZU84_07505 [Sphingobacterium sp.]|nr:hypothetical protein [Sphingobacterium sp.]